MRPIITVLNVPVHKGCDLSEALGQYPSAVIFTDTNCREKCLSWLLNNNPVAKRVSVVAMPAGVKNLAAVDHALSDLVSAGAGRDTLLICLGGGSVGDLGGFIASVYKRGMPFLNVPTTLLSMSDSCVGGKTATDHAGIRNLLGTYKQPVSVCVDTHFLGTLSSEVLVDGYSEIIKHAALSGGELWNWVCSATSDPDFDWLITESLKVKKTFVEADPYDASIRMALNFGHTVAHGIEANSDTTHGQAVAIGLIAEGWLSVSKVGLPLAEHEDMQNAILTRCRLPDAFTLDLDGIAHSMLHDKKNDLGELRLSLLERIGQPKVQVVCSPEEVLDSIKHAFEVCPVE